ncbi:uncharacterized protein [Zea mays]|uniref:uncharacterized protein isoform X2 n=1 Tax=Zea mays TaxID=4577 RepID=UPI000182B2DA|nr:uncharacterized protein LOC103638555 isoform X2 [Zea mays]|eukprot:XP_008659657.1 uncharacterized protein LOC103638555 isoform X2 [Zea mays]
MNPYLENNFLVRLMEEMEEEEEELQLARYMVNRRRRALNERRHGGSIPGRVRIHRDHMSGDARIRADYFGANPVYTDAQFRRRFRMRRHVFERLVHAVQQVDPYFIQRPNCAVLADTTQGSMEERNDFVNQRYNQLKDRNKYTQLQVDLIHHHWARHGSGVA